MNSHIYSLLDKNLKLRNGFQRASLELPKPFGSPSMIYFDELSICIGLDVGKFASPFQFVPSEGSKWQLHMDAMMQPWNKKWKNSSYFSLPSWGCYTTGRARCAVLRGTKRGRRRCLKVTGGTRTTAPSGGLRRAMATACI